MEEVVIHKMGKEDLDKVIELGMKTKEIQTGTAIDRFFSKETLERWTRNKNGVTLIAMIGNKEVGFLLGDYLSGLNYGYLDVIIIDENYRGRGIGNKLLEHALKEFKKKGDGWCRNVFSIIKPSNEISLKLFEKHGFKIGEIFKYAEAEI